MKRIALFLLDLLFPNRCGCCGTIVAWNVLLCADCTAALQPVSVCGGCGKQNCICLNAPAYDAAFVAYCYAGAARDGILSLKRGDSLHFAIHCAGVLAAQIQQAVPPVSIDCVVPVPMAKRNLFHRGYNQAEELAAPLANALGLPLRTDCLHCAESDTVQHKLAAKERTSHAARFTGCQRNLQGMRILLCDDVLTTGSTLNRCAAQLRAQGAACVYAAVATTSSYDNTAQSTLNDFARGLP